MLGIRMTRAEAVLVLLALVIRAAYAAFHTQSIYFDHPVLDSLWIHQWASSLAAGEPQPHAAYFRAPLYPYVVAGVYAVVGAAPWVVAVLQHLLGVGMVALTYRLGRRLFDETVGRLAGGLLAFYWVAIFFEGELLIVTVASALGLGFLVALAAAVDRPDGRRRRLALLGAGVLLGLAAIARPNFVVVVPLALLWPALARRSERTERRGGEDEIPDGARARSAARGGWSRWARDAVPVAIGILVPIMPVTFRNIVIGGDPVLIAAQGGLNLYVGNGPGADGKTAAAPAAVGPQARETWATSFRDNVTLAGRAVAEGARGRPLRESEVSRYWLEQTWAHVQSDPLGALGLLARKTFYLLNGFEISDNRDLGEAWHENPALMVACVRLAWVLPFAWVGFVFVAKKFPKRHLIVYFVFLYSFSIVLFFVNARFRLILAPATFLLAAAGMQEAGRTLRRVWPGASGYAGAGGTVGMRPGLLLAAGLVGAVVANVRAFDVAERRGRPAFDMNRGFLLLEEGDCDGAIRAYESVARAEPRMLEAAYQLARALERCGDRGRARDAYARVSERWPGFPYAYVERARLEAAAGDTAAALEVYAAGIAAAPTSAELRFGLAGLNLRGGRFGAAADAYRAGLSLEDSRLSAWMNYGYTLVRLGELDAAVEAFRRVLALNPSPDEARMARRNIDRVLAHTSGAPSGAAP